MADDTFQGVEIVDVQKHNNELKTILFNANDQGVSNYLVSPNFHVYDNLNVQGRVTYVKKLRENRGTSLYLTIPNGDNQPFSVTDDSGILGFSPEKFLDYKVVRSIGIGSIFALVGLSLVSRTLPVIIANKSGAFKNMEQYPDDTVVYLKTKFEIYEFVKVDQVYDGNEITKLTFSVASNTLAYRPQTDTLWSYSDEIVTKKGALEAASWTEMASISLQCSFFELALSDAFINQDTKIGFAISQHFRIANVVNEGFLNSKLPSLMNALRSQQSPLYIKLVLPPKPAELVQCNNSKSTFSLNNVDFLVKNLVVSQNQWVCGYKQIYTVGQAMYEEFKLENSPYPGYPNSIFLTIPTSDGKDFKLEFDPAILGFNPVISGETGALDVNGKVIIGSKTYSIETYEFVRIEPKLEKEIDGQNKIYSINFFTTKSKAYRPSLISPPWTHILTNQSSTFGVRFDLRTQILVRCSGLQTDFVNEVARSAAKTNVKLTINNLQFVKVAVDDGQFLASNFPVFVKELLECAVGNCRIKDDYAAFEKALKDKSRFEFGLRFFHAKDSAFYEHKFSTFVTDNPSFRDIIDSSYAATPPTMKPRQFGGFSSPDIKNINTAIIDKIKAGGKFYVKVFDKRTPETTKFKIDSDGSPMF